MKGDRGAIDRDASDPGKKKAGSIVVSMMFEKV
jgi:hypothetical protein